MWRTRKHTVYSVHAQKKRWWKRGASGASQPPCPSQEAHYTSLEVCVGVDIPTRDRKPKAQRSCINVLKTSQTILVSKWLFVWMYLSMFSSADLLTKEMQIMGCWRIIVVHRLQKLLLCPLIFDGFASPMWQHSNYVCISGHHYGVCRLTISIIFRYTERKHPVSTVFSVTISLHYTILIRWFCSVATETVLLIWALRPSLW